MNTLLSVFGGGLWVIPLLLVIGASIFTYIAIKASNSGDSYGKLPFLQTGYGVLAIALWVAFVGTIIWMISDK